MRPRYVQYNLEDGFIHNWLVAGPQTLPIEPGEFGGKDFRHEIARRYHDTNSGIAEMPVERGPLDAGLFQVGDFSGSWNYYACQEDHFVDHSDVYSAPQYLRSWAYAQLESKKSRDVLFVLTTHGPVDVWLNGIHVERQEHFAEQRPESLGCKVTLKAGVNKILVRFEAVVLRERSYAMALRVCKPTDGPVSELEPYRALDGLRVRIPTLIEAVSRRNKFERVAMQTFVSQDVFEGGEQIQLCWPKELEHTSAAVIRLMTPTGSIYAESTVDGTAGDKVFLGFPQDLPAGPYRILMMPLAWEYYDYHLRITREIPIWSLERSRYSATSSGTFEQRRQEALVHAAQQTGPFAEIAKMALNLWDAIDVECILGAVQNAECLELVGLLGMLYRFGEHPQFPKEILPRLEESVLGYPYESGAGYLLESPRGEADLILLATLEILAGQRYQERTFLRSGKTGKWHRQNGERRALEWAYQRGEVGFSDWDSNLSFAQYLLVLSHLVDLAETESVWEMAAVVMDKIFLTIALNAFQGVFGSTQGRSRALFVKGGLLQPTSGITRLMWGVGISNAHIPGPVSLACAENYELPSIISEIALSDSEEMWDREHHAVKPSRIVNKVTYKTPDAMLCSAQDYYPGESGGHEHIWQATLGPTATVFVTHPACSSENDACQPNFWSGNAILPRVAQWKDVLIAVYQLPEDDWMGFTHAYFPSHAFDEYIFREDWAFARKGAGYLALRASQGFDFMQHGRYAFRELRSYGQRNIWLCHTGRSALDGDFASFQEKILALQVEFSDGSVRFPTLRGETLSFGWQGPFLREQIEQPLSGFDHYDNPYASSEYPSRHLELRYGEASLHLNFERAPDSQLE